MDCLVSYSFLSRAEDNWICSYEQKIYVKLTIVFVLLSITTSHTYAGQVNVLCYKHGNASFRDSLSKPLGITDSIQKANILNNKYKFSYNQLVVPVSLIGIGAFAIRNGWMEHENRAIDRELHVSTNRRLTIDNISQYVPMAMVYGLNLGGIKGVHSVQDETIILATSYLSMGIAVNVLKRVAKEERPDESDSHSFPSGHTATAFMGAEFLWREYKDVSPLIGVAGYLVASGTGFLRVYNNKHWATDVISGAGFGILSTKLGYWLYPVIKSKLFSGKHKKGIVALPYYNMGSVGVCCTVAL